MTISLCSVFGGNSLHNVSMDVNVFDHSSGRDGDLFEAGDFVGFVVGYVVGYVVGHSVGAEVVDERPLPGGGLPGEHPGLDLDQRPPVMSLHPVDPPGHGAEVARPGLIRRAGPVRDRVVHVQPPGFHR